MKYRHVFGPVPSRRLGLSLGIDLVTNKSCNLNCIFCECGETKEIKKLRNSFKKVDEIKKEIREALKEVSPDYITFSGSGEPTLSKDLGEIIKFIKKDLKYKGKIALITNSVLLKEDGVLEEIMDCDLIIPTLNTLRENTFQKISRSKDIRVEAVKEGLKKLSISGFSGEIFLELFILENINDDDENLEELVDFIKSIRYTKVQLNSLARVGAQKDLKKISIERLQTIKKFLENKGLKNIEIINDMDERNEKISSNKYLLSNMLEKRKYLNEELLKIYKNIEK